MNISLTKESPFAERKSRPTPRTLEDLKKLNPRTAAVILGGALARRKMRDRAKLGLVLILVSGITVFFSTPSEAQRCYTVRNTQGMIVYQSLSPPVDITLPYKDEIELLFPGGYMDVEHVFKACGKFTQKKAPMEPEALQIDVFGDVGVATFVLHSRFEASAGQVEKREKGTLVFFRDFGSWKFVHEHFSAIPAGH